MKCVQQGGGGVVDCSRGLKEASLILYILDTVQFLYYSVLVLLPKPD